MHIGIDVRNLVTPTTGIARYLLGMSGALVGLGARLTLYWPQAPVLARAGFLAELDNRGSVFTGHLGRLLWSHTVLPAAVRRDRPDVFWGPSHRLPPFLRSAVPTAVTIHDLVWNVHPETMRYRSRLSDRLQMRSAIRRADAVLADSEATRNDILRVYGELPVPVQVVYPGVDSPGPAPDRADVERVLRRYGVDRPYALFVGSREPRKNLDRLIAAFHRMNAGMRDQRLLVIAGGDGWRDASIRSALERNDGAGRIRLTGYIDDSELAAFYAGARLLAMPSLYEGFGLPVVEAQRHGVPALVSTAGSLPEVVGEGGIAVPATDVDAMAQAMKSLFENDALHARLSDAAVRNVARFSWTSGAARLLDVFAELKEQGRRKTGVRPRFL